MAKEYFETKLFNGTFQAVASLGIFILILGVTLFVFFKDMMVQGKPEANKQSSNTARPGATAPAQTASPTATYAENYNTNTASSNANTNYGGNTNSSATSSTPGIPTPNNETRTETNLNSNPQSSKYNGVIICPCDYGDHPKYGMREDPTNELSTIYEIPDKPIFRTGQPVYVNRESRRGAWFLVETMDGKKGWMHGDNLKITNKDAL